MSRPAHERSRHAAAQPGQPQEHPRVTTSELAEALAERLGVFGDDGERRGVVWSVGDERVGVRPEGLRVSTRAGSLVIELPLVPESGGKPLPVVTTFRIGRTADDAVLRADPEDRPLGDARLAARWNNVAAEVLWAAVLELGAEMVGAQSTNEAPLVVAGLFTEGNRVHFAAIPRFRELDAIPTVSPGHKRR